MLTTGTGISWDRNCFGSEIMVPSLQPEAKLSSVTIGAIEDFNYTVNYDAVEEENDSYKYQDLEPMCQCLRPDYRYRRLSNRQHLDDTTVRTRQPQYLRERRIQRKLSPEGYRHAVKHGRAFLESAFFDGPEVTLNNAGRETRAEMELVGANSVHVLVEQDGEVHSVFVEK